ncbi:MAG: hypothetical protein WBZ36_15100 [Candidatus Nitrosopolaris sp.]
MSRDQDRVVEHQRVAVVTGSSSSIGKETALTLAKNNFLLPLHFDERRIRLKSRVRIKHLFFSCKYTIESI